MKYTGTPTFIHLMMHRRPLVHSWGWGWEGDEFTYTEVHTAPPPNARQIQAAMRVLESLGLPPV